MKVVLLGVVVAVFAFNIGECCGPLPEFPDYATGGIASTRCGRWLCEFFIACSNPGGVEKLIAIPNIPEHVVCSKVLSIFRHHPCNCFAE